MKQILLTNGGTTLIDDDDFEVVSKYTWFKDYYGYVVSDSTWLKNEKRTVRVRLNRLVMNAPSKLFVDHKHHDLLDNRKSELRLCSPLESARNRRKPKHNTSGYKGVYWDKQSSKWKARIKINGKNKHLGYFADLVQAGEAYIAAAKEMFGEFACIK